MNVSGILAHCDTVSYCNVQILIHISPTFPKGFGAFSMFTACPSPIRVGSSDLGWWDPDHYENIEGGNSPP